MDDPTHSDAPTGRLMQRIMSTLLEPEPADRIRSPRMTPLFAQDVTHRTHFGAPISTASCARLGCCLCRCRGSGCLIVRVPIIV